MKRTKNGLPIIYELKHEVEFSDEFGDYKKTLAIQLIWNKGFRWGISTGDFSIWDKSLPKCAMFAIRTLLTGNLTPCYYRLKEHIKNNPMDYEKIMHWGQYCDSFGTCKVTQGCKTACPQGGGGIPMDKE